MERRAVLAVPGRMLGPYVPSLYYIGEAAEARGGDCHVVHWPGYPRPEQLGPGAPDRVAHRVAGALDTLDLGGSAVVIAAKSLGTMAAPVAQQRALPVIWLTPVLTDAVDLPSSVFIDAVRTSRQPCLIVGGTADELWDGDLARDLSPHVLEIPGADHSLQVGGPLSRSTDVLGEVVTAVERFLDEVAWVH